MIKSQTGSCKRGKKPSAINNGMWVGLLYDVQSVQILIITKEKYLKKGNRQIYHQTQNV